MMVLLSETCLEFIVLLARHEYCPWLDHTTLFRVKFVLVIVLLTLCPSDDRLDNCISRRYQYTSGGGNPTAVHGKEMFVVFTLTSRELSMGLRILGFTNANYLIL